MLCYGGGTANQKCESLYANFIAKVGIVKELAHTNLIAKGLGAGYVVVHHDEVRVVRVEARWGLRAVRRVGVGHVAASALLEGVLVINDAPRHDADRGRGGAGV